MENYESSMNNCLRLLRKNVFYLRKKVNKKTYEELAEELDLSRDSLFKLESDNDRYPNLKTILKLSLYFKVSIGDLLEKDIELEELNILSNITIED